MRPQATSELCSCIFDLQPNHIAARSEKESRQIVVKVKKKNLSNNCISWSVDGLGHFAKTQSFVKSCKNVAAEIKESS